MIRQVSLGESRILEDDMICLRVSYRFYLPVAFPGISSIPMEAVCVRRGLGRGGGRGSQRVRSQRGGRGPDCLCGKGLHRAITSAPGAIICTIICRRWASGEVSGLRNAEGGRYSPASGVSVERRAGTVYVMPSGSSYHTSPGLYGDCGLCPGSAQVNSGVSGRLFLLRKGVKKNEYTVGNVDQRNHEAGISCLPDNRGLAGF